MLDWVAEPCQGQGEGPEGAVRQEAYGGGWLSALLGYLAKRDELKVRLKYIDDVTLRRTDFEALAAYAYYTAKCWPKLPEELARAAGSLLKPQEAPFG